MFDKNKIFEHTLHRTWCMSNQFEFEMILNIIYCGSKKIFGSIQVRNQKTKNLNMVGAKNRAKKYFNFIQLALGKKW